jgi:hypothetical protein
VKKALVCIDWGFFVLRLSTDLSKASLPHFQFLGLLTDDLTSATEDCILASALPFA